MIRITDVTLCTIDHRYAQKDLLLRLYKLLLQTGINFIEINVPILNLLGEKIEYEKTILRVEHPSDINRYTGFIRYVCRHSGYDVPAGTISEFQINDVRELNLLRNLSQYLTVRFVGLDDLLQHDYLNIFERLKHLSDTQAEFCPQNSYYCATALAVEWILNGGENIAVSFCGSGGFAALEEVMMALRIAKRHKPNLDLSVLREVKRVYEELSGINISGNKPVVGNNIFEVESGIHVDGIFKNGANYEPFEPSVVGMERKIIVGKHSGRTTIEIKLMEFGLVFPDEKVQELLRKVQDMSIDLGRSITDQEFYELACNLTKW